MSTTTAPMEPNYFVVISNPFTVPLVMQVPSMQMANWIICNIVQKRDELLSKGSFVWTFRSFIEEAELIKMLQKRYQNAFNESFSCNMNLNGNPARAIKQRHDYWEAMRARFNAGVKRQKQTKDYIAFCEKYNISTEIPEDFVINPEIYTSVDDELKPICALKTNLPCCHSFIPSE